MQDAHVTFASSDCISIKWPRKEGDDVHLTKAHISQVHLTCQGDDVHLTKAHAFVRCISQRMCISQRLHKAKSQRRRWCASHFALWRRWCASHKGSTKWTLCDKGSTKWTLCDKGSTKWTLCDKGSTKWTLCEMHIIEGEEPKKAMMCISQRVHKSHKGSSPCRCAKQMFAYKGEQDAQKHVLLWLHVGWPRWVGALKW